MSCEVKSTDPNLNCKTEMGTLLGLGIWSYTAVLCKADSIPTLMMLTLTREIGDKQVSQIVNDKQ